MALWDHDKKRPRYKVVGGFHTPNDRVCPQGDLGNTCPPQNPPSHNPFTLKRDTNNHKKKLQIEMLFLYVGITFDISDSQWAYGI